MAPSGQHHSLTPAAASTHSNPMIYPGFRLPLAIAGSAVLAAAGFGCADGPVSADPEQLLPEERVESLRVTRWPGISWAGTSIPIRVEAWDSAGAGVAGVTVDLEMAEAGASLSAVSLVTDSLGRIDVEIAVERAGANQFIATVRGRDTGTQWSFEAVPRPRVSFSEDTVRLPGTGCQSTLYAPVLDEHGTVMIGSSVNFVASNPEILSYYSITVTGSYRGMLTGIVAETPGTTSIVATHASGAADTAVVTVDTDVLRVVSIVDADELQFGAEASPVELANPFPGDTLRWGLWSANECGRHMPAPVEWASTDPSVASVDGMGTVTIGKHGHAMVIGSAGGLADTVKVETLQVEPRDTTVAAGDTVHYRLSIADAAGVLQPVADLWAQPHDPQVATPVLVDGEPSARVVGVARGSTDVWISAVSPEYRSALVRLEVVDR